MWHFIRPLLQKLNIMQFRVVTAGLEGNFARPFNGPLVALVT